MQIPTEARDFRSPWGQELQAAVNHLALALGTLQKQYALSVAEPSLQHQYCGILDNDFKVIALFFLNAPLLKQICLNIFSLLTAVCPVSSSFASQAPFVSSLFSHIVLQTPDYRSSLPTSLCS